MRIIAGQWRGRKLRAPRGEKVRPTTDRTKEALFNILGPQVRGCIAVDLCCGSGGLGLEALSRGAEHTIFVDVAQSSLASTKINLELCGVKAANYSLEQADSLNWILDWEGGTGAPWILICDPPYQSTIAAAMMSLISQGRHPTGLICAVIEYGPRTPGMPDEQSGWQLRRYGESHLAIFRPDTASPSQEI